MIFSFTPQGKYTRQKRRPDHLFTTSHHHHHHLHHHHPYREKNRQSKKKASHPPLQLTTPHRRRRRRLPPRRRLLISPASPPVERRLLELRAGAGPAKNIRQLPSSLRTSAAPLTSPTTVYSPARTPVTVTSSHVAAEEGRGEDRTGGETITGVSMERKLWGERRREKNTGDMLFL